MDFIDSSYAKEELKMIVIMCDIFYRKEMSDSEELI